MLNELFLYNLNDCSYYVYSLIDELGLALSNFKSLNIGPGILNIMTIVHKEPHTERQCMQLKESWNDMLNVYKWVTVESIGDTVVSFASNVFFNTADVLDEIYWIAVSYLFEDWEYIGKLIAKITSDLMVKNPIRNSYNYRNSQFIKYRLYKEET